MHQNLSRRQEKRSVQMTSLAESAEGNNKLIKIRNFQALFDGDRSIDSSEQHPSIQDFQDAFESCGAMVPMYLPSIFKVEKVDRSSEQLHDEQSGVDDLSSF